MALATEPYRRLCEAAANLVGLPSWTRPGCIVSPGTLLEAVILTESGGNPKARRYEAHQDRARRRDAPSDADVPDLDDGELEDDASYGLMQVMGTNARRLLGVGPGVAMRFGFLFRPILNVSLGLSVLLGEWEAVKGLSDPVARMLCRYNGGPTGDDRTEAGGFRLEAYADNVARCAERVKADRAKPG